MILPQNNSQCTGRCIHPTLSAAAAAAIALTCALVGHVIPIPAVDAAPASATATHTLVGLNFTNNGTAADSSNTTTAHFAPPTVISAQSFEAGINLGLVSVAFAIIILASGMGARAGRMEEYQKYRFSGILEVCVDLISLPQNQQPLSGMSNDLIIHLRIYPMVIGIPTQTLLLIADVLLDFYCLFSLVAYLFAGVWDRGYGYSPFYFLFACSFALVRPRTYNRYMRSLDKPALTKKLEVYFFRMKIALAFFILLIWCFTLKRMFVTGTLQFNGVRTVVRLTGNYSYQEYVDYDDISAGMLYTDIYETNVLPKTSDVNLRTSNLWGCNILHTPGLFSDAWNSQSSSVDGSLFNSSTADATTLSCYMRQPQLMIFFWTWGIFMMLALVYYVGISLVGEQFDSTLRVPMNIILFLYFVDWMVVLVRDATSPGINASLIWCPTRFYRECKYIDFGDFHPSNIQQSIGWITNLGPYHVDKIAGYGMADNSWLL